MGQNRLQPHPYGTGQAFRTTGVSEDIKAWVGIPKRVSAMQHPSHSSTPTQSAARLMERLKRNNLTPDQDVISKIVALFNQVTDRPTALQVSKQVSVLLTEAGSPCNENLALEAMASYKGFRSWDALVVKLPKGVKPSKSDTVVLEKTTMPMTPKTRTSAPEYFRLTRYLFAHMIQDPNITRRDPDHISKTMNSSLIVNTMDLFDKVTDYSTTQQISKQVMDLFNDAGHNFSRNLALEAMAAYKGFRNWNALEASIKRTDDAFIYNRFYIGKLAFLRRAQGSIPAGTQVTVQGIPKQGKERLYLGHASYDGKNLMSVLRDNELLTKKDLEIQYKHGGEQNIVDFASAYGQEFLNALVELSIIKDSTKSDYAVNDCLPNILYIHFYSDNYVNIDNDKQEMLEFSLYGDNHFYIPNDNHEMIEFSQMVIANKEGGYTILPQRPYNEMTKECESLTPGDKIYDWPPELKIKAGTSPHDAARQVVKTIIKMNYNKIDCPIVKEDHNTSPQPKI
jgi:hypothetical protein